MSSGGPFPSKNTDFNNYVSVVVPYLTLAGNAARLGISAGNVTALGDLLALWSPAFATAENPATATTAAKQVRDNLRKQFEELLRSIYHDIPESVLTELDRTTLHITAADTTPTASTKPTVAPVVSIDKIQHLQHLLRFQNPDNPNSHAKPDGVNSIEIYGYITNPNQPVPQPNPNPAPTEDNFHHAASTGRFLYTLNFTMEDVGKTVYYIARYRSTRGEFGPFSVMVSALVA